MLQPQNYFRLFTTFFLSYFLSFSDRNHIIKFVLKLQFLHFAYIKQYTATMMRLGNDKTTLDIFYLKHEIYYYINKK